MQYRSIVEDVHFAPTAASPPQATFIQHKAVVHVQRFTANLMESRRDTR